MSVIQENVSLLPYNTFGIDVTAKYFTVLRSVADARALFSSPVFQSNKKIFLGGGSNVLFTKNFDGLAIKVEINGREIVTENENTVHLKVGAGESWHETVMYAVSQNWGGIENLSLIPGSVGAAPMQNIGAYGVEIKEVVHTVEALDISTGEIRIFTRDECRFGYRESIFKQHAKEKFLISSVTLILSKKDHRFNISYGAVSETMKQLGHIEVSVKAISDAVIHIRRSKLPDPTQIGNAGSFFKNPSIQSDLHDFIKSQHPSLPGYPGERGLIKVSAAWLIEHCGWKGKRFNNIGVHQHQSLVLVNYGGGDGASIWQLAMKIQSSVHEKFNIVLQPEVNVI